MQPSLADKTLQKIKADRNVEMPPKKLPDDSRTSKVMALSVGDTYSESVRLPVDNQDWDQILNVKRAHQRWMPNSVHRAIARLPDTDYQTTVGEFRGRDGAIFVTAVITRVQ